MKELGKYTFRGQMQTENEFNRILLFDGKFNSGFRITSFKIAPYDTKTANNDVTAKIVTDEGATADGALWDFSDNREIAWTSTESRVSFGPSFSNSWIDPDHLIVQDMYISYGHVSTDSPVNYLIEATKYDITDWQGALAMVRNSSQDV